MTVEKGKIVVTFSKEDIEALYKVEDLLNNLIVLDEELYNNEGLHQSIIIGTVDRGGFEEMYNMISQMRIALEKDNNYVIDPNEQWW